MGGLCSEIRGSMVPGDLLDGPEVVGDCSEKPAKDALCELPPLLPSAADALVPAPEARGEVFADP